MEARARDVAVGAKRVKIFEKNLRNRINQPWRLIGYNE